MDGLSALIENYEAIVATVEEIVDNIEGTWNDKSCVMANGTKHAIVTFQFVLSLEVTRPLTKQLQTPSFDAGAARQKVSLLYVMLKERRSEIDYNRSVWYKEAVTLAEKTKNNWLTSAPRRCYC